MVFLRIHEYYGFYDFVQPEQCVAIQCTRITDPKVPRRKAAK